jgi:hypothetical protein
MGEVSAVGKRWRLRYLFSLGLAPGPFHHNTVAVIGTNDQVEAVRRRI